MCWRFTEHRLRCVVQTHGGGNAANALTSAARLGLLSPALITKIGSDSVGDQILAELEGDGLDVRHVLRAPDAPSPFSYLIIDRKGVSVHSKLSLHDKCAGNS